MSFIVQCAKQQILTSAVLSVFLTIGAGNKDIDQRWCNPPIREGTGLRVHSRHLYPDDMGRLDQGFEAPMEIDSQSHVFEVWRWRAVGVSLMYT